MNNLPTKFDFDITRYPQLPSLSGVFVTGTDTEVGKTLVCGAIARALRSKGRLVEVFKPVASGCRKTPAGLISEDSEFLAWAAESRRTLAQITPLRFGPALAPNVAADRTKSPVNLNVIFDAYRALQNTADVFVVEGVGGLLCPISDSFWVIHFAKMTGLPMVIVARPDLGTINHTLLTIHAARTAGINVAGVIINRYNPDPKCSDDSEIAMQTNPQQISELGGVPILALVPDESENSVSNAVIGPDTQFAIDSVDWDKILSAAS